MELGDDPHDVYEADRNALLAAWVQGSQVRLLGADSLDDVRGDLVHLQRAAKAAVSFAASAREYETRMRERAGEHVPGSRPHARFAGIADTLNNAAYELERLLAVALKLPDATVPDHPPPAGQRREPDGE